MPKNGWKSTNNSMNQPQKFTAVVAGKEKVSSKVYLVNFKLINPPEIEFTAGQNIMLFISSGVNRTMSIASPPSFKTEILMAHDVSPMGPGSVWTLNLKVGDQVEFMGPTGGSLTLTDSGRKKILIATGSGIAPFHSMILDKPSLPITLYWGLRHAEDIFWQAEFQRLETEYPNFHFNLVLSKPDASWQGKVGHVTEHVLQEQELPSSDFYLCGNKAMVDELKAALLAKNVPIEQIKTELFY